MHAIMNIKETYIFNELCVRFDIDRNLTTSEYWQHFIHQSLLVFDSDGPATVRPAENTLQIIGLKKTQY